MNKYNCFLRSVLLLLITAIIVFIPANKLFAKHVNSNQAKKIATNFYIQTVTNKNITSANLSLAYTAVSTNISNQKNNNSNNITTFYIFNINTNDGFIIISADDALTPVLGYTTSGNYTGTNMPPAFIALLEKYSLEISYVVSNNIIADSDVKNQWEQLKKGQSIISKKGAKSVSPLLSTKWGQGCYYNESCPADAASSACGHTYTGCAIAAMAQVMKYWNHPIQGTDSNSYTTNYGVLSVNFGNTTYNWSAMANNLTSSNNAVATLMYHCGVAANVSYSATGSGTYIIAADSPNCVENAYKTYFRYSPSLQGLIRAYYVDSIWINLLKNELDASRPVQYAGWHNTIGHSFVLDGYDISNYFHINWGWDGVCDGYFSINALTASSYTFNSDQQAIIGIQPYVFTCTAPTIQASDFYSSSITSNSMKIHWTRGNGNKVLVVARAAGASAASPTSGTEYTANSAFGAGQQIGQGNFVVYKGSGTSVTVTGLTMATSYYFDIYEYNTIDNCYLLPGLNGNTSTSCSVIISTFPYVEEFENGGTIPLCWTQETTSVLWKFIAGNGSYNPSVAHTGSYNACLKDNTIASNKNKLISPRIDLSSLSNPTLKFWHTQKNWQSDQDELRIYYKTSASASWSLLTTFTNNVDTWTEETITLPSPTNDYYIAFEGDAKYAHGVCIDDISICNTAIIPVLNVSPSIHYVSAVAGSVNFNVTSNIAWTAFSVQSWCAVTSSGNGNGIITASYSANPNTYIDTAVIIVNGSGISTMVKVIQSGYIQPLSNDDCSNAALLTQSAVCNPINSNSVGATQSMPAITCTGSTSTAVDDVWYQFVALTSTSTIKVVGSTGFDAVIDLRSGSCNGTNIACSDNTYAGGTEIINASGLTVGEIYYIRVYGYSNSQPSSQGTFTICIFGAYTDILAVTPAQQNVSAAAGSVNFNVTSNIAWTAASNKTWCTVTPSGNGNGIITANYSANTNSNIDTAIIIVSGSGLSTTVKVIQSAYIQPLSNDDCSNAVLLTQSASCNPVNASNINATLSIPAITCGGVTSTAVNDVWFQFVAVTPNPTIKVVGSTGFDPVIDLRSGSCNGTTIGCSDNTYAGGTEIINASGLTVGTIYYIRVYGYSSTLTSSQGTFTICVYGAGINTISVSPANQNITSAAGSVNFNVTSNIAWSATSDQPWCAVTPSGNGNGTITANCSDNTGSSQRVAIITVSGTGANNQFVTVIQDGNITTPEICVVSIDSATGKNIIVWNKPVSSIINYFNVYRRNISTVYAFIGKVPYSSISTFIDSTSVPLQQSYRYKLSATYDNSIESALSNYHQTMHLSLTQDTGNTYNLSWIAYEGFPFQNYSIYRGTSLANLTLLTTIPSTNNSYTDLNPPTGIVYYQIEVLNPNICSPSKRPFDKTKSNIADNSFLEISESEASSNNINIYPNPGTGLYTVECRGVKQGKGNLKIYDCIGQQIYGREINFNNIFFKANIDISDFSGGIYSVKIEANDITITRRIIKQ